MHVFHPSRLPLPFFIPCSTGPVGYSRDIAIAASGTPLPSGSTPSPTGSNNGTAPTNSTLPGGSSTNMTIAPPPVLAPPPPPRPPPPEAPAPAFEADTNSTERVAVQFKQAFEMSTTAACSAVGPRLEELKTDFVEALRAALLRYKLTADAGALSTADVVVETDAKCSTGSSTRSFGHRRRHHQRRLHGADADADARSEQPDPLAADAHANGRALLQLVNVTAVAEVSGGPGTSEENLRSQLRFVQDKINEEPDKFYPANTFRNSYGVQDYYATVPKKKRDDSKDIMALGLGLGVGLGTAFVVLVVMLLVILVWRRNKVGSGMDAVRVHPRWDHNVQ